MSSRKLLVQAAAGAEPEVGVNVEDIFSTYLYSGTGATQSIVNNLDLSGVGGLTWLKMRTNTAEHKLFSTTSGAGQVLRTTSPAALTTVSNELTSFNSDGFTLGSGSDVNSSGNDFVSFSFLKSEKFFDIVTYTGNSTGGRTVSHNLGSTPGMIIIKKTSGVDDWVIYHQSIGNTSYIKIGNNSPAIVASNYWNNTDPTDSVFTLGSNAEVNESGFTYIAYLFAHNNGDGEFGPEADQDIIKCGSYTGNGSQSSPPSVNLGFEPQFLLVKNISSTGQWYIWDSMREVCVDFDDAYIVPNTVAAEVGGSNNMEFNATGFRPTSAISSINGTGYEYMYMAIRRGPMAVPTDANDVFSIDTLDATQPAYDSGHEVDFAIQRVVNSPVNNQMMARLQPKILETNLINAQSSDSYDFDYQNGVSYSGPSTDANDYAWMWKRAPSFCDVVCYTGNVSSNQSVSHNLSAVPEMMWVKCRSATNDWNVYHKDIGNDKTLYLNTTAASTGSSSSYWGNTTPTDAAFTVGPNSNGNNDKFIAYLFSSLNGVSKIGSYTGNGGTQNINCGFSSGARFVLIKRTDSTGDWLLFDSDRGIIAGNDPHIYLNDSSLHVTSLDLIDPYSAGFSVTSDSRVNASSGSYIFYAIA